MIWVFWAGKLESLSRNDAFGLQAGDFLRRQPQKIMENMVIVLAGRWARSADLG